MAPGPRDTMTMPGLSTCLASAPWTWLSERGIGKIPLALEQRALCATENMPDHRDHAGPRGKAEFDLHQPVMTVVVDHHAVIAGKRHHYTGGDCVTVQDLDFGFRIDELSSHQSSRRVIEIAHFGPRLALNDGRSAIKDRGVA